MFRHLVECINIADEFNALSDGIYGDLTPETLDYLQNWVSLRESNDEIWDLMDRYQESLNRIQGIN